ncbi:MAG TPA: hypothetical protein VF862_05800 [Gemmatimonadales bacterium]
MRLRAAGAIVWVYSSTAVPEPPLAELRRKFPMERQLSEWLPWQDSERAASPAAGRSGQVQALVRRGGELNTPYGILGDADAGPAAQVAREFSRVERAVRALRGH